MIRTVEDLNAYELHGSELVKIGRGITHYRFAWQEGVVGGRPPLHAQDAPSGLYGELLTAEIPVAGPPTLRKDGEDQWVDIPILLDDEGQWSGEIQTVVDAHIAQIPARLQARADAAAAAAAAAEAGLASVTAEFTYDP